MENKNESSNEVHSEPLQQCNVVGSASFICKNCNHELLYPEFIKLFEGGEGETKLSIGWIDAQEEQPLCVSIGDWDGKQSDIVLAETFTGKKFLAQCYEGFMDGSAFFDWYQVDEVDSNEWLINESVSRWMKIPF